MRRFSACTARYIQWLMLCLLGFATPTFSQALTSVNARAYVLADITSGPVSYTHLTLPTILLV